MRYNKYRSSLTNRIIMIREILFSRNRFLIRKRATEEIRGKDLIFYCELYFQKTDSKIENQYIGEYVMFSSKDKTIFLAIVKIISPRGLVQYYLEDGNRFRRASIVEVEDKIYAFEKEFQEKYEIIIRDAEIDALMDEALSVAKWELF
jgi:hypothetical protein